MFLTFEGALTTLQYSSAMESISLQMLAKVYTAVTGIVNVLGKYIKKNKISQSSLKVVQETDTY